MAQYHDPSDIVLACQNQNYSYSAELECLVLGQTPKLCKLTAPQWSLDSTGLKLSQAVYNLLSNPASRVVDPSEIGPEYENAVDTPAGTKQLIAQGGYAHLVEI
jgi:hypothetical protein